MKNYTFTRSMVDKFNIKGYLTEDGENIEYENSDKEAAVISISQCLEPFKGENITLTIAVKTDQDLGSIVEGE